MDEMTRSQLTMMVAIPRGNMKIRRWWLFLFYVLTVFDWLFWPVAVSIIIWVISYNKGVAMEIDGFDIGGEG